MGLAPNHSHPGSLLTGCHSGSLSDHEKVRGHFGLESGARLVLNQS